MDETRFVEYCNLIKYSLSLVQCFELATIKHGIHPYYIYITSQTCNNCVIDTSKNNSMSIMLMRRPMLKYGSLYEYVSMGDIDLGHPDSLKEFGMKLSKVLAMNETL